MTNAKQNRISAIARADHKKQEDSFLKLSFEYIDWDDSLFFIHGLEANHYKKLFETFIEIKRSTEKSIVEQSHSCLSPKSIFNTANSKRAGFPEEIIQKIAVKFRNESVEFADSLEKARDVVRRAFEVSMGKNYGRIHAFIWHKVFYVVWFDPAHNLYPGKGGAKEYVSVRCFSPDAVAEVKEKNKQLVDDYNKLKAEYDELYEAWANSHDT